jgi:hypothetical protein
MIAARRTDPETSRQAAESLDEDYLRISQQAILTLMTRWGAAGLMDHDMIKQYAQSHLRNPQMFPYQSESGLRTRRKELVDKGLVVDSGRRGVTRSGRKSIYWVIAEMADV